MVSERQVLLMEYCVGLTSFPTFVGRYRTFYASKNYFSTGKNSTAYVELEDLVRKGYAKRHNSTSNFINAYSLTEEGLERLSKEKGFKIKIC